MTTFLYKAASNLKEPWYSIANGTVNLYRRIKRPERVTHPGEMHPDKTFYIIDDLPSDTGIASWYDRVIGYVLRAENMGYVPVIVPRPAAQPDDGNWYSFFKGVNDIPVNEALHGKNVVFATPQAMIYKRYNIRNVARRHSVAKRIPFSDDVQTYIDSRIGDLFRDAPSPMVGVKFRGTDYRCSGNWRPVGHAKVPAEDIFCDRVEADCKRWGIPIDGGAHIFLVTEEQEAFERIRSRFPKCRFVEKERYTDFEYGKSIVFSRLPTLTPMQNNFMYLLEIMALVRCDYLIGGFNGGVLMATNLNGNAYKGVDILDFGTN